MKKAALGGGLTITILTGCVSSPQSQEQEASNSNLLSVEFVGNSSIKSHNNKVQCVCML